MPHWCRRGVVIHRGLPTHGHSAALVERGGGAYVVFVGGGTGSILDDPARCQEHSVAQVLDLSSHRLGVPSCRRCSSLTNRTRRVATTRPVASPRTAWYCTAAATTRTRLSAFSTSPRSSTRRAAEMAQAAASAQAVEGERRGLARRAISRLAAGLTRSVSPPATVALQDLGGGETTPTPRKFHAACSLYPWRPLLVIFGGWQVDRHFDDMWVLAHGGDLASYGTPDGYGSDDDDEVEIVLQVGGRRERVLIERSTLEALLENGRFTELSPTRTAPSPCSRRRR